MTATRYTHLSERERRRLTEPKLVSLFDAPPVIDVASSARVSDPPTSHEAKKMNRVARGSERHRLLVAFASSVVPMTDDDASHFADVEYYEGRRRCADLRRFGLIADSGVVGVSRFGNSAMRCVITDEGRATLRVASGR